MKSIKIDNTLRSKLLLKCSLTPWFLPKNNTNYWKTYTVWWTLSYITIRYKFFEPKFKSQCLHSMVFTYSTPYCWIAHIYFRHKRRNPLIGKRLGQKVYLSLILKKDNIMYRLQPYSTTPFGVRQKVSYFCLFIPKTICSFYESKPLSYKSHAILQRP